MKKTAALLLTLIFLSGAFYTADAKEIKGPFNYSLADDINRNPDESKSKSQDTKKTNKSDKTNTKEVSGPSFYAENTDAEWETEYSYYPNASINSAVRKYQQGNYSGCLQEMISLTKKDSSNPIIYYYMAMSYTQTGNKDQAVKAYEKVIKLNSEKTLTQYATRGRDCLVGGPACGNDTSSENTDKELDDFVSSPYGNGFSDQLNKQVKEEELKRIQKTINKKPELEEKDIQKIQEFDEKSELKDDNRIAQVTNDDVLAAIETLKKAGVTVSINSYPMDNQYNELSMFLGNNNNNNSMMNMVPYLMAQNQSGKNIDPQIIQAMMMNSMLPDFTFSDNNKKY